MGVTLPDEDPRLYDPMPDDWCAPHPTRNYAGTGIGALYGLGITPAQAASLAGWSLPRPSGRRAQLEGWDYEPGGKPE
jgi:hypothetical protein